MAEAKTLPFESAAQASRVLGFLDTGNYALNYALSGRLRGGWPLGHTVEIFGDPSTGKSYLLYRAFAKAQEAGGIALLDEPEGSFNAVWAEEHLGVNADALRYTQSMTVSDHLKVGEAFTGLVGKEGFDPGVMGLDSLAVLSTDHELKEGLGKRDMTKAQEVRALFRILKSKLRHVPVTYLIANHVTANIGGWNDRTTPGGGGPKYHSGVRVDLRSASKIKREGTREYLGVIVNAFVEKNRFGPPWKQVRFAIPFYEPLLPSSGLIPVLLDVGYLHNHNHWLVVHTGEELKLRVHKTDFLKQDQSARELLEARPALLEEADAYIAQREAVFTMAGAVLEESAE